MGTITSHTAAQPPTLVPASKGEITVADILTASGAHAAGDADRYFLHQWAVILITRGGYRVGLDASQAFDAEAGELIVMRPETGHAWTTADHPRGRREGVAADTMDSRVRQVIEYMASHLDDHLTIEQQCRVADMSRSQLAAIFEPATGLTPMRYLEKLRLEQAMQLLQMTSRTIDSIAAEVGFCDAKHFAKRFRAVVGTTPTAHRQSHRTYTSGAASPRP